jgi:hypothetical protein
MTGMPRVALSCARGEPPPAAPIATAATNAIAGAARRVLIGVPFKDIPILCQIGVNLVTCFGVVNAAGDHDWVMKDPSASNPRNTATAGQGGGSMAESDA